MNRQKVNVSAGAALLFAALYLLLDWEGLAILALPIAVHELGHFLALRAVGGKVRMLRFSLSGLCITYTGMLSLFEQFLVAFAGPAAGMLLAIGCAWCGHAFGMNMLTEAAGVSIVLSIFNMLPAIPLDGGRMLTALLTAFAGAGRADRIMDICGVWTSFLLMLAGLFFIWQGKGCGLEIAAVWLSLCQTIVKKREVL